MAFFWCRAASAASANGGDGDGGYDEEAGLVDDGGAQHAVGFWMTPKKPLLSHPIDIGGPL